MKNTWILKAAWRFFRIFSILFARRFCPPGNGDGAIGSDEDLMRLLPENCRGAYDAFKSANDEIHSLSELGAFADSFRLGIRRCMEIMKK